MISYPEALALLCRQKPLAGSAVAVRLADACGRVAAAGVQSSRAIPSFATAAMDGFALCSEDIASASLVQPIALPVMGLAATGGNPVSGQRGSATAISTGAPVPAPYDAVVKIEDVKEKGSTALFSAGTRKGAFVRSIGADIASGDRLLEAGQKITSAHVMALAAAGIGRVEVAARPQIKLWSSGKELVESGELGFGQIYNASRPYLHAELQRAGYEVAYQGLVADDPAAYKATLKSAVAAALAGANEGDVFISTGAVSAGTFDFIPQVLAELDAEILFHKIAMRPGMPSLYARWGKRCHYFGLAGNPISSAVGLRFLVLPLLAHLQGAKPEEPVQAKLSHSYKKQRGSRFILKATVKTSSTGQLEVKILDGQESFRLKPLLDANAWAVLAENQDELKQHDVINVYYF